jgi:hypothetical protein
LLLHLTILPYSFILLFYLVIVRCCHAILLCLVSLPYCIMLLFCIIVSLFVPSFCVTLMLCLSVAPCYYVVLLPCLVGVGPCCFALLHHLRVLPCYITFVFIIQYDKKIIISYACEMLLSLAFIGG